MIRLARVIETFEPAFLRRYGTRLSPEARGALSALRRCRCELSPRFEIECSGCHARRMVPHSCGHRHCPHCQHHESRQWLERQMKRLVPAAHFLLTFTLPAELRPLASYQPRLVYDQLLRCAWETVQTFSHNDRKLRGALGAIAVLHTHSRRLDFYPHVHLVMPAAAIEAQARRWRTKEGCFLGHKALAKVFRARLLAALEAAGLTVPARAPKEWVVDCRAVGSGAQALTYLGRYLYRGVIGEEDILSCAQGQVSFRYREAKSGKMEERTLPGEEFLWLAHALPLLRGGDEDCAYPRCPRVKPTA